MHYLVTKATASLLGIWITMHRNISSRAIILRQNSHRMFFLDESQNGMLDSRDYSGVFAVGPTWKQHWDNASC